MVRRFLFEPIKNRFNAVLLIEYMIVRIFFSHYHPLLLHLKNIVVFNCGLVLELHYDQTPLSLSDHESRNLSFTVKAGETLFYLSIPFATAVGLGITFLTSVHGQLQLARAKNALARSTSPPGE